MENAREQGTQFMPKFDDNGLMAAIIVDDADDKILMLGHMNSEALNLTQNTGKVHFYSRSRQALWLKGETSGNFLAVKEIWVDCDQDALVVRANPAGPTCHTGVASCFYRRLVSGKLEAK